MGLGNFVYYCLVKGQARVVCLPVLFFTSSSLHYLGVNWKMLQPVDFLLNSTCDTGKRQALAFTLLQLANQNAGDTIDVLLGLWEYTGCVVCWFAEI